ncbi:hypothetical protein [Nitrosospira sp. Nsp14]|uniref:hypothetical protein n=1 Tax=Nitrosospira sp. Nsp14 TaxID=1855333 RepID=UPI000B80F1C4|nr:hypothetical protein [Nitrosospira sp. Nsp14]
MLIPRTFWKNYCEDLPSIISDVGSRSRGRVDDGLYAGAHLLELLSYDADIDAVLHAIRDPIRYAAPSLPRCAVRKGKEIKNNFDPTNRAVS